MTQVTFNVGDQVRVTTTRMFNTSSRGMTGRVTRARNDIVHVDFPNGTSDWGYASDVQLVAKATTFKVGDNVKVVAEDGGVFLSRFEGKTGKVVSIDLDDEELTVEFEGGARDYGRISDVELVVAPRREDQANNGMTVGDRIRVNADESKRGSFYARLCGKTGVITQILARGEALQVTFDDGSKDCGYTHGVTLVSRGAGSGVEVAFADMKKGMKVRYMGQPADGGHTHWGFELGKVYDCIDRGVRRDGACDCRTNYGKWRFELVTGVEGQGSLSEQLAALRSQLNAIKTEKQTAEAEVAAARTKVNAIEARRVALVATLTAHGIQFIAE